MSNFKSGSGNLDFGGGDEEDDENGTTSETTETEGEGSEKSDTTSTEQSTSTSSDHPSSDTEQSSSKPISKTGSTDSSEGSSSPTEEYPYFVRRRNVGDERDTRLEIHVRDKVANQEAEFRNELAELLGANEISKTDAREFALLAAFHNPEQVAELMQDEGFGTFG